MNQIQLIIQPGRGYAKAWYIETCKQRFYELQGMCDGFEPGPAQVKFLEKTFEDAYNRQTPTGFHKNGKQINLDVVYRAGVDTLAYPLPDWWLSYGGEA